MVMVRRGPASRLVEKTRIISLLLGHRLDLAAFFCVNLFNELQLLLKLRRGLGLATKIVEKSMVLNR
jgi:hypothetical protein